jgi:hypothetical protein
MFSSSFLQRYVRISCCGAKYVYRLASFLNAKTETVTSIHDRPLFATVMIPWPGAWSDFPQTSKWCWRCQTLSSKEPEWKQVAWTFNHSSKVRFFNTTAALPLIVSLFRWIESGDLADSRMSDVLGDLMEELGDLRGTLS